MQFETVTIDDLDEIRNLQPQDWSDIIPEFEFYIQSSFCSPIKTKIDDKIVGIGASIIFKNTSWIAHIIVDSEYRNKGIGAQIVNELLDSLKRDSVATCSLIATELGKPVYLKAGFRIASEYSFFQREKQWVDCPVSENVIPFEEKRRAMIYELDHKISGEKREPLLTDYLSNSKVFVENNKVLGYYIPDLKEGLIYADTDEAGLELMKLKYAKVDKAVLPSDNSTGVAFLLQKGFTETRKGTRMILGKDLAWNPKKMFGRIGGNFG
ncbi:MAG: GNAT family N-acetyltransferase [Flavobacteriaceae bacterium]|nr:GNAT family N-acetyltransferase [Flavobacteriaceae bacterium]